MKLPVRRIVWGLVGVLVVGAIVYALLPRPVAVEVARAERGTLRVTVDDDGKTRIRDRYVVAAPLSGRMVRIYLRPGDKVKASRTLLTTIEPTDPALLDARALAEAEARVKAAEASKRMAEVKVPQAQAALELAHQQFARARRLIGTKSVSREEYDTLEHRERTAQEDFRTSQIAVQVATFELEQARAALIRTRPASPGQTDNGRFDIRSPIDGRVLRVFQESATVVTPGLRLLEVGDPTDLEVEVDVLSSEAVKVAPGARVLLEQWGGDEPLNGRVRLVEPQGFLKVSALGVEEQRVNVIIDLTDPLAKRSRLGDGYRVEARIVIYEGKDVLKVPAGALFRQGDGWAAYVVQSGRAELRAVRPGRSNGLETEVREGLEEGEEVIVYPSDKVRAGVAVQPR